MQQLSINSKKESTKKRNDSVRFFYHSLAKKNPHFKIDFLLFKTAEKFFISKKTIVKILCYEHENTPQR